MKSSKSILPQKLLAMALSLALTVTWMIPSSLAAYATEEGVQEVTEESSSNEEAVPSNESSDEVNNEETSSEEAAAGDTSGQSGDSDVSDNNNEEEPAAETEEPAEPATALPEAVNGTITLTQDVNLADVAVITEYTELDLAGHTITGTSNGRAIRVDASSLTITDSSADQSGRIVVNGNSSRAVIANAPVVAKGGTIVVSGQDSAGIVVNNCSVMINGTNIEAEGLGAMGVFDYGELKFKKGSIIANGQGAIGIYMIGDDSVANVSGGSISVEGNGSGYGIEAVELGETGNKINISGGTISTKGTRTYAVYLEMDNTLNISDGTLKSENAAAVAFFQGGNKATITGGTIVGGEYTYGININNSATNEIIISGETEVSGGQGAIYAGGNRYKSTPAVTITGGYFNGGILGGTPSDKTDNYAKYDITGGYFTDKIEDSALYNYSLAKDFTPNTYSDEVKAGEGNILFPTSKTKDEVKYQYRVIPKTGYVLMNIPYDKFYAAELAEGSAKVDAVTSATKNKPRTGTLAGGSYHKNKDGSDISGVIYPVLVSDVSALKNYDEIKDESSVEITVANRGKSTTTTYSGKDALFEAADYSYYILTEEPSYYKTATVGNDGSLSFSEVNGEVTSADGVTGTVTAGAKHADIEIKLSGTTGIAQGDAVSGVVLTDNDGNKYGLRHVVNVWRATEIGWNTADYALSGKTITNIRYYTQSAVIDFPVEIVVPKDDEVAAAKAKTAAENAKKKADTAAEAAAAAKTAAEEAAKTPGDAAIEAAQKYEEAAKAYEDAAAAAKEAADKAYEAAKTAYGEDSDQAKTAQASVDTAAEEAQKAEDSVKDADTAVNTAQKAAEDKAAADKKAAEEKKAAEKKAAEIKANNGIVDKNLPKVKIKKPAKARKSFTAKWKKLSKKQIKAVKGVEIEYSLNKDFSNPVKFKTVGKKKAKVKIKKLKSKKVYYVRAHTYKVVKGVKYVSPWSATKKVKVK